MDVLYQPTAGISIPQQKIESKPNPVGNIREERNKTAGRSFSSYEACREMSLNSSPAGNTAASDPNANLFVQVALSFQKRAKLLCYEIFDIVIHYRCIFTHYITYKSVLQNFSIHRVLCRQRCYSPSFPQVCKL